MTTCQFCGQPWNGHPLRHSPCPGGLTSPLGYPYAPSHRDCCGTCGKPLPGTVNFTCITCATKEDAARQGGPFYLDYADGWGGWVLLRTDDPNFREVLPHDLQPGWFARARDESKAEQARRNKEYADTMRGYPSPADILGAPLAKIVDGDVCPRYGQCDEGCDAKDVFHLGAGQDGLPHMWLSRSGPPLKRIYRSKP